MKLEINRKVIFEWLEHELSLLSITVLEAHIFGSILNLDNLTPNDVDLFIKYKQENIAEIVKFKKYIQTKFFNVFNITLHLLVLNEDEVNQSNRFLEQALSNSLIIKLETNCNTNLNKSKSINL